MDKRENVLKNEAVLKEVEDKLRKELNENPKNDKKWCDLGLLLIGRRKFDEAEKAFRNAININPRDIASLYNIAMLAITKNNLSEAESTLQKIVEIDPKHSIAWFSLGKLMHQNKNYQEAEEAFKKGLETNPQDIKAWNNLGKLLEEQHKFTKAELVYQKSLEINPKNIQARLHLEDSKNIDKFPVAFDSQKVGTFSVNTKVGGGYFWDSLLEYRYGFIQKLEVKINMAVTTIFIALKRLKKLSIFQNLP